eukprot:5117176-Pyramimonas_sp.AAC.1
MVQSDAGSAGILVLHFTGPPVPTKARAYSTPQRPFPFSHPVSSSPRSAAALPLQEARVYSHDGPGVSGLLHASSPLLAQEDP